MEVPGPEQDKPRLGRVGIIALVGFVIGAAWPRLAGVKLVPSAPADDDEGAAVAADSAEPASSGAPAPAPPAEKIAEAPPADSAAKAGDSAPQRILVKESTITSCHDDQGRKQKTCDKIDFGSVLTARVEALAACSAAEGAKGILSIGFDLDFKGGKVEGVTLGKSTTLPDNTARELLACAKKELPQASIDGIQHKLSDYTVFYVAELVVPGAAASAGSGAGPDVSAASGQATVGWEAAIIREAPKDGKVVARILRGTRVVVTGKKDDWYRIKYDAKGSEGWVYRSAIGL